jgi:hypothetical protein
MDYRSEKPMTAAGVQAETPKDKRPVMVLASAAEHGDQAGQLQGRQPNATGRC